MMSPFTWRLGHPSAHRLQRFADRELNESTRQRIAAHLARCQRCRELVVFNREIAAAARHLPAPVAPPSLIHRVILERSGGARVILPSAGAAHGRGARPTTLRLAAIAAAVALMALLSVEIFRRQSPADTADPNDSLPTFRGMMLSIGIIPAEAYGQEASPSNRRTPPIEGVDGSSIAPLALTYELTVTTDSEPLQKPEHGEAAIAAATYNGAPAWRLTNRWFGHRADLIETTYVERRTLRPLARSAHNVGTSHFVVEQRFVGDSLLGTLQTLQGRRELARELPAEHVVGPLLVGEAMPIALMLSIKLVPGWRGRAVVVGWGAVRSDVTYPIALHVEGEERVSVPAGTFDCWRVVFDDGRHEQTLWVRKTDQLAVMSRDTTRIPGQLRQVVLLSTRSGQ